VTPRRLTLVTGATGCLGSNLVRRLVEQGENVAVFRLSDDSLAALDGVADHVEHRLGDVRDADSVARAMVGVDRVYHLAGVAVLANGLRREMEDVNVRGAENVARAALAAGVSRLVHTSSAAAVGWPDGEAADEGFPFNGDVFRHSYMVSKWRGEQVVRDHVRRGLDAVILNPTAVIAPRGSLRHGWAALVLTIMRRRLWLYPRGGLGVTTRADVVDAQLKAMERGRRGERYIVNTRNLRYGELCTTIASVVGVQPPQLPIPGGGLSALAVAGSAYARLARRRLDPPFLVRENVPMMTRLLYYDQAKAVRELGISQSPLEDAVAEVQAWCVARRAA
jgi:dihydroflavonol-4-reductase